VPRTRTRTRTSPWAWLAFLLACSVVAAAFLVNPQAPVAPVPASAAGTGPTSGPAPAPGPVRPLANDCSAGVVHFTFDDGPNLHTDLLLDRLAALHVKATFFVMGERVVGREATIRREVAEGHSVQNHTYRHFNLVTGEDLAGVERRPWGESQIRFELQHNNEVIEAAGAPRPAEYRPPYGSVSPEVDAVARSLGLRLIMPWGDTNGTLFADSRDTEAGASTQDIVRNVVTGLHPGVIITMHDGEQGVTLNSAAALQEIVDTMNVRHLCTDTALPRDATGGVFHTSQSGSAGRRE
jgi:peptidoglycan/xylan/chitin deacetylase (PgdA/CDA1 family)